MMKRKKWTKDEEQKIVQFERERVSASDMAVYFGVFAVDMLKKIHELKLRKGDNMAVKSIVRDRNFYDIKRGNMFYIYRNTEDPETETGSEQRCGRPAIIVSNDIGNHESSVVEVVYITTKPKADLPTHVIINSSRFESAALCEQITTVDKSRIGDYAGTLSADEMAAVDKALAVSLGINIDTNESSDLLRIKDDEILQLKAELDHCKSIISNVEKTKNASYESNENFLTVKTERDTYLGLYNKLLERVLNGGVQKGEV